MVALLGRLALSFIFMLVFILPFLFLLKLGFDLKSSPKVFGIGAVANYVARPVVEVVF